MTTKAMIIITIIMTTAINRSSPPSIQADRDRHVHA
jgi:hypothetical protein